MLLCFSLRYSNLVNLDALQVHKDATLRHFKEEDGTGFIQEQGQENYVPSNQII